MLSTSTAVAGATTLESVLRQSEAIVSSESASRSSSSVPNDGMTQAITFSSGNPRIEETRGVVHLYLNDLDVSTSAGPSSSSKLPVDRKPLVCVLGIPNHMTYADFCRFCGSFVHHILEMRIVRNDGPEDGLCVLVSFDSQDSTDNFYSHFNGRPFSSLEDEICRVLFALDVQYTGSKTHSLASSASSNESPSCPVCLERLDQDTTGILTTVCNHSFHCSCISKWTDSSCPVCRYCQQQPEKSTCFICQTSENLWMCVICGFVGCGRYKQGHAITHWKETEHCYSLELETQRVWDYAGDNYVHRLIQSKTDGELVELNTNCPHGSSGCRSCECSDFGFSEAILNSKVEAIKVEYNELLTTQLENQKQYFESLLQEAREETEREISEAVERASVPKLQKMQAQHNKCLQEKKFLDDLNENLLKNQEIWEAKIAELEAREKKVLEVKDDMIQELEKQLRSLMACLEGGSTTEQFPSTSNEITDCTSLRISAEPDRNKTKGQKKAN